jgi:SAM-dependent methyltransferase
MTQTQMPPEKTIGYLIRYAAAKPQRVLPFVKRAARNWRLNRAADGDFSSFYRRVMAATAGEEGANRAIGSFTEEHWQQVGRMQFDYLVEHGLKPQHRVLDIGCGNLRAGIHLIDYLEPGNYVGVDLSPEILFSAQQNVAKHGLQDKMPYLVVIDGTTLDFLPSGAFDVAHAHSVFSHTPLAVYESYVAQIGRLLAPSGFFDFTFIEGERERNFLAEDFHFPAQLLLDTAAGHGLRGERQADWDYAQAKIRLRPA